MRRPDSIRAGGGGVLAAGQKRGAKFTQLQNQKSQLPPSRRLVTWVVKCDGMCGGCTDNLILRRTINTILPYSAINEHVICVILY